MDRLEVALTRKGDTTLIDINVATNALKNEISGVDVWRKRINLRVKDPPVQNRANKTVMAFFSNALGIKKCDVKIISGHKKSQKTILVKLNTDKVKKMLVKNH